jgi:hypothetical protein
MRRGDDRNCNCAQVQLCSSVPESAFVALLSIQVLDRELDKLRIVELEARTQNSDLLDQTKPKVVERDEAYLSA